MKLEKIEFGYNCRFNQEEIETILHTILNSRKLKSIGLSYASFTNISPKTIEEAVKSLEQICFDHSHLSEEQCVFISRSLRRNCRLKYLGLGSQRNIGLLSSKSLRYLMSPKLKRLDLGDVIFSLAVRSYLKRSGKSSELGSN